MSDTIPYQAYRSKRHSHPHLLTNISSPPVSWPSSITRSPSSSPSIHDREGDCIPGESVSPSPVVEFELLTTEPNSRVVSPTMTASTSPTPSSSAGQPSSLQSDLSKHTGKKGSTFRHVPFRNTLSPFQSSPLAPSTHTLSQSLNGHTPSVDRTDLLSPGRPTSDDSQRQSNPRPHPSPSSTTPPLRDGPLPSVHSPGSSSPMVNRLNHQTTPSVELPPPASMLPPNVTLNPSHPSSPNRQAQKSISNLPSSKYSPQRVRAPYRPGIQPKGIYRPLTDDFIALRRLKRDGEGEGGRSSGFRRVERAKLTRRLEKLIDIHFPVSNLPGGNPGVEMRKLGNNRANSALGDYDRRASSLFDFTARGINMSDPGGLWRGVVGGGKVDRTRAAEQRVTPWQDDGDVSKCPLCGASFHPLTNRKHHCRLCGQIICSLPIKRPHRPAPCSLLFIVDPNTRMIEEVGEGVDYGVRRKRVESLGPRAGVDMDEEKFLKGVRICRACRPILLHQKYQQETLHVPTFAKLYEALIGFERQIEASLPVFQELVLSISHNDQPKKEASAMRKRLLEAFTQYDALSKRIRKLPCPNGSSQDRVQMAITTRANLFLQKNMFSLQSLPTPQQFNVGPSTELISDRGVGLNDPDSNAAFALQPLLEQEALLESFVEEAKIQRKFEDVQTLKANLREIRAEIEKVVLNAQDGVQDHINGR